MKISHIIGCLYTTIFPIFVYGQSKPQEHELSKIYYDIQSELVVSTGDYTPFWLVSNRHGITSFKNNNANIKVGLFRDFTSQQGWDWTYGAEVVGTWNHTSQIFIQQLYADVKYNCWELSIGSKERWSEGKHHSLSGGGLTFAPNARPIPQVRFGINEYTTVPWWFNDWIQVKGHFSYGRHTDDLFQQDFTEDAVQGTRYVENVLFHEKTAFLKIGNKKKGPFSIEMGLEMYSQFGGRVWEKRTEGDIIRYDLPHGYKDYIKAFIPMKGGSDSPDIDRLNISGNILGSWHFAACYDKKDWYVKAYYEHFYEDHSQLFGIAKNRDRYGNSQWITYHPWKDGLYGIECGFPQKHFVNSIVCEYITSRDQSGPILHNSGDILKEQISGFDFYYNHSFYQSWHHWGMSNCNPHFLSPLYNDHNLTMPNQRIRSYHIGVNGTPTESLKYRILFSWTKHWGSLVDPLPNPLRQISSMCEITYLPQQWKGWTLTGAIAYDQSKLIGNNFGGILTLRRTGKFINY